MRLSHYENMDKTFRKKYNMAPTYNREKYIVDTLYYIVSLLKPILTMRLF